MSTPQHRRTDWGSILALESAISALIVLILVFLWSVTTGGYFWPGWVIFALAVPIVVQLAVRDMPTSGKPAELLAAAGIDAEHIAAAARRLVEAPAGAAV